MPRDSAKPLTLEEAYQAAFLWFDHKGEPPESISEPAHGSIQVTTETTLARVRMGATPADQSSVLALLRADPGDKKLAIFSTSGFTPGAISVAETQGMALYEFDTLGVATPKTTHARSLAPETDPPVPFAPSEPDPEPAWSDHRLPGQAGTATAEPATSQAPPSSKPGSTYVIPPPDHTMPTSASDLPPTVTPPPASPTPLSDDPGDAPEPEDGWSDCPTCGTSHFRNARFCRSCGTNLITGRPHGHSVTTDGTELVCNTCGSTDIAAVTQGPSA